MTLLPEYSSTDFVDTSKLRGQTQWTYRGKVEPHVAPGDLRNVSVRANVVVRLLRGMSMQEEPGPRPEFGMASVNPMKKYIGKAQGPDSMRAWVVALFSVLYVFFGWCAFSSTPVLYVAVMKTNPELSRETASWPFTIMSCCSFTGSKCELIECDIAQRFIALLEDVHYDGGWMGPLDCRLPRRRQPADRPPIPDYNQMENYTNQYTVLSFSSGDGFFAG